MPHIGPPALRRSEKHRSNLDWGEKMLSKGWQFIEGETSRLHKFKKIRISKRYENDLPIFLLQGEDGGQKLKMEMKSYARAYWKVVQPLIGPLTTLLYYNEYPVNLTEFEYRDGSERWTLSDLGRVVGNCEHAWGII